MGFGDFVKGVGEAAVNVGKGAVYLADPRNMDNIAEGVGNAAEFVVKNPGKTWDVGFEVGRAIAKDQTDPLNLAINAGLLAATVATGGAAAPALVAKLGMGAKSVAAGVSAAKGMQAASTATKALKAVDTARDTYKAGKTALKVADTVRDTAKAVDTAGDVTRAVKSGAKGVEATQDVTQNLSRGQRFTQDLKQTTQGLRQGTATERFDTAMSLGTEVKGATREAIGLSRYGGMAQRRANLGQKALTMGEDAGKVGQSVSKYAARKIGGELNPLLNPQATTSLSRAGRRVNQIQDIGSAPGDVKEAGRAVEVAADPTKAVEKRVSEEIDKRAGQGSGYTDLGQTKTDMYGGPEQMALPAGQAQSPFAGTQTASTMNTAMPTAANAAAAAAPPAGPPPGGSAAAPPAGPPPGGNAGANPPGSGPSSSSSKQKLGKPPKIGGGAWMPQGQHFWEGPRSQWAGGIQANYDWRPVDPLRKISSPTPEQAGKYNQYKTKKADYNARRAAQGQGDLNEQGAPSNFSPEVPKSGAFALSQGQQPFGSLNPGEPSRPELESGPTVRFGEARGSLHNLGNVRTRQEPVGAVGPGPATAQNSSIIDADSFSPEDYKFDTTGQGYFDFANTMGTAAVGQQPNTDITSGPVNPAYQSGSRTSRRGPGALGV